MGSALATPRAVEPACGHSGSAHVHFNGRWPFQCRRGVVLRTQCRCGDSTTARPQLARWPRSSTPLRRRAGAMRSLHHGSTEAGPSRVVGSSHARTAEARSVLQDGPTTHARLSASGAHTKCGQCRSECLIFRPALAHFDVPIHRAASRRPAVATLATHVDVRASEHLVGAAARPRRNQFMKCVAVTARRSRRRR